MSSLVSLTGLAIFQRLGLVAITVWRNSLWPVLLLPGVVALMHYGVIRREEEYLTRLFGGRYKAYRRRVRRWI